MNALRRSGPASRQRGFTVVELICTLTIMAVIISYGVPHFQKSLETSRVDMASSNLQSLWTAERLYWSNNQTFTPNLSDLQNAGFLDPSFMSVITSASAPFQYAIPSADATAFQATATRVNSTRWSGQVAIDQTGSVTGSVTGTDGSVIAPSNFN